MPSQDASSSGSAARPLQVARILWGALLFSNFLYLAILFTVRGPPSAPPAEASPPIAPMFVPYLAVVALVVAVASFLVPGIIFAARARAATLEFLEEPVLTDQAQGFRTASPGVRFFADPASAQRAAVLAYFPALVLGLALSETVSIFGFIAGFLGAPVAHFAPFFAAGVTLQLLRFPTLPRVRARFEAAQGARFRE